MVLSRFDLLKVFFAVIDRIFGKYYHAYYVWASIFLYPTNISDSSLINGFSIKIASLLNLIQKIDQS